MTLLEFCRDFFPGEEIFSSAEEGVTVHSCRLLELENAGKESGRLSWEQVLPSDILDIVQPGSWWYYNPRRDKAHQFCWNGEQSFLLTQEALHILEHFQLVIDRQAADISIDARRPYFRMRGRPVTEEQAFDIIRRTDNFFRSDMCKYNLSGLVSDRVVLDNLWYSPQFYPHPLGWVRPDGVVGMNNVTGKYPNECEFLRSVLPLITAFPYLDLVIAITDWNVGPDYAWNDFFQGHKNEMDDEKNSIFNREDYPDFLENIVYGIWLHDNTAELMAPERAREKYAEYNRFYGGPDEQIFTMHYYEDRNIHPADLDYLKRLICAHGLDPEEVLANYEWGPSGLRLQCRGTEKENTAQFNELGGNLP